MNTIEVVTKYLDALKAQEYRVQLTHEKRELPPINLTYTTKQFQKSIGFLKRKNLQGYNIYTRPLGYQFVLLDDLTKSALPELAKIKPCLLLETSPANYQAWLILPETPATRENALAICRHLAKTFKADPAAAEPDHVGRLVGFRNRKEKHKKADGTFPIVLLHGAEHRFALQVSCQLHPTGGTVENLVQSGETHSPFSSDTSTDLSRNDFAIGCMLIRKGFSDSEITEYLLHNSPNLEARKGKWVLSYIERTIRKCRYTVKS